MKKVIRLTEGDLTRIVKRVIREQSDTEKISGSPIEFLNNSSTEPNRALGVLVVPKCFEEFRQDKNLPRNYPPSKSEIEDYIDYLGVYGDVPGTKIPIPYESSDLQYMVQILQGLGTPGPFGGNYEELGPLYARTAEYNGRIYPTVELIRAAFNQGKTIGTLGGALKKKITDSKEDWEQKQKITSLLLNAYKVWMDCVNGSKLSLRN